MISQRFPTNYVLVFHINRFQYELKHSSWRMVSADNSRVPVLTPQSSHGQTWHHLHCGSGSILKMEGTD